MSHNHTGIHLFAGTDKEGSSLLGVIKAVGDGLAGLKSDEGSLLAVLDIPFVRAVAVKNGVHDAIALGVGHKFSPVTDKSSGRNGKGKANVAP